MLYQRRCRRLFQSTLPHGSDSGRDTLYVEYYVISILAPSRERLHDILGRLGALHISILAPSRERHCYGYVICSFFYFNPRSLAGATRRLISRFPLTAFQSSLPRGSDRQQCGYIDRSAISILAPSRERRFCFDFLPHISVISILAPSRERPYSRARGYRERIFQSSLPHGSD